MEEELKQSFLERFGNQTFCDNCNYVLSMEQEEILNWWLRKIKEINDKN